MILKFCLKATNLFNVLYLMATIKAQYVAFMITSPLRNYILESPNFDGVTFDLLTFANKTNII